MERNLESLNSLNPGGLDGLAFVHSSCHEPLGLELGKTLRAETTDEEVKKRDKEEQHTSKYEKVGGPRSEKAFWQDLTATGGDVEVDEEGVR